MADRKPQMTKKITAEVFGILGITEVPELFNTGSPGYVTTAHADVFPDGQPMGMVRLTKLCTEIVKYLVNRIIELKAENAQLRQQLGQLQADDS